MPTFLDSHYKLQQLQSRLSKNQYLSNDCLPNSVDARVFKSLKAYDKIPKQNLYPSFYHWYILMSQFSQNSLQHWLDKRLTDQRADNVVSEAIMVIEQSTTRQDTQFPINPICSILNSDKFTTNPQKHISTSLFPSQSLNVSSQNQSSSLFNSFELPKVSSHIQKKPKNQSDLTHSYIMDIKLTSQTIQGYQNVKKIFQLQTYLFLLNSRVKLESIKVISGSDLGYDVRVFFVTDQAICEQLKGKVLACGNVQTIQCKKQKRNQSL